jgi:hypothetical protein
MKYADPNISHYLCCCFIWGGGECTDLFMYIFWMIIKQWCVTFTKKPHAYTHACIQTYILSRGVTRQEVWIGNWIYWTLTLVRTTNNYDNLTELHSKDHCNYSTHKVFSVFPSRCLIAATNGGHTSSSWFSQLYPASTTAFQLLTIATLN